MEDCRFVIAKNLTFLRKKNNLTQAEVAKKLDYSDKTVSKWETGETEPSIEVLKGLAAFYLVSIDDLVNQNLEEKKIVSRQAHANSRLVIALLGVFTIWLIATVFFALSLVYNPMLHSWLLFIYAIPASCVVALVFNSIWGRTRRNYIYISILTWSCILSLYISLLLFINMNAWPAWLIGIPAQIMIVLWANIKKRPNSSN